MSRDLWYYSRDGVEKQGPTPGDHLRSWIGSGHLNGDQLVWRPGLDDWTPIQELPELRPTGPSPARAAAETVTRKLRAALAGIQGRLSHGSLLGAASWKILIFVVAAPWIVVKMVVVPSMASRAAAVWAERYGIEMSVEDWSADVLDLSAAAKNAVIRIPGPYDQKEFVSAETIEVDLSLLSGLLDGQWIQEIRVRQPKIYLERLLAGRWNWEDLMSTPISPPVPTAAQASSSDPEVAFSLPRLSIEGMRLQWVENLPGGSKSGIIQETKATLFVDDISASAKNLVGPVDLNYEPNSSLSLEARTGSGKISLNGRANFFSWMTSEKQQGALAWMPMLSGKIYLENVGSNAFARLVPDAALVPEGGNITGNIELELTERQVDCQANLDISNVTFTANPASRFVASNSSAVDAQLAGYTANGQYHFSCGGLLGQGTYRPFQAFHTNVIRQGVSRAPKNVQALAAVEHVRYSQDPIDPSVADEANAILGHVDAEWLKWAGFAVRVDSTRKGFRFRRPFRR